ncbi:autotransporter domain-containing protein [Rhodopseudomonas sp. BR0M22]|uniref:autotransporter outer membrane beta-barrel domain-containing protein n=2 Tax=unclassified Rhodopseudomonas TaxID=2638247 RepID=UPI001FEDF3D2|nr:autotransporter domain-containing protein [Rhodopseudomonas sp. BR0M22]
MATTALLAAGKPAHAQQVWIGADQIYNTPSNWSGPAVVPDTGDSAVFRNNGASTSLVLSTTRNPNDFTFEAGAPGYSIGVVSGGQLNFNGAGIVNNSGNLQQFLIDSSSQIDFRGSSTAADAKITNIGGTLIFSQTSAGGTAEVVSSGGALVLRTTSGAISIGSLSGSGTVQATAVGGVPVQALTIGSLNTSTEFSGTFVDNGAQFALGKTGTGTLTLTGDSFYTGGTTISSGTLQLGNGGISGSITGDITNNATLAVNRSNGTSLGGVISGTGQLVKLGGGILALLGNNTYTGGTTISAGTLRVGNGATSGSIVGDVVNNGVLQFNRFDSIGFNDVISGTGSVTKLGNNSMILGGDNTYTGGTTISGGYLQIGNGGTTGSIVGDVVNNGTLEFARSDAHTFSGAISGTGNLISFGGSAGTGVFTMTGTSTYTGGTIVSRGILQIGDGGTSGSILGDVTNNATLAFNRSDATSFGGAISGGGSLIKRGSNNLSLTGTSSYTGATTVEAGTLSVNGSIAASSLTTVNAGGTLGGTGTVGTTLINGGALAPGNSIGTLNVSGNLTFTAASSYMVEVSPSSADRVNVSGTATLGGATVNASFASGGYVERQYTIVSATGGVVGTFGTLVNTNLPSGFRSSLGYDANNAYLNLVLDYTPSPDINSGLNRNQTEVANALSGYFARTGNIPIVFGALTPAGLSAASGETATGAQQSTFNAMTQFLGVLTDPSSNGRGAPDAAPGPLGYADRTPHGSAFDAYAMITKSAAAQFVPHWNVWGAGFGGAQTTDGNASLGSATATSRLAGIAAGADYWLSPQTVAGFAMAGGATQFGLAGGLGSGTSDLIQVGGFVRHSFGASYLTAAAAYGWQDITTERTVAIGGLNQLRANFNANAYSARVEAGHRWIAPVIGGLGVSPYAAAQVTAFDLPAYAEQAAGGTGVFALGYAAKTVTATRSELGVRTDKSFALDGALLTLRGRAGWAHDFDVERSITATFQTLPGASFVVNGARPARDAALTTVSAEVSWLNGFSVGASFEGEFSDVTRSYAGKGVLRYAW